MVAAVARKQLLQQSPEVSEFEADVLEGLRVVPKSVPAKYFYDAAGSHLFERITELSEYYPTRCEMRILRRQAGEIAKLIQQGAALVEFGSGSSRKARILLKADVSDAGEGWSDSAIAAALNTSDPATSAAAKILIVIFLSSRQAI